MCSLFLGLTNSVPTIIAASRIGWGGVAVLLGCLFVAFLVCYSTVISIWDGINQASSYQQANAELQTAHMAILVVYACIIALVIVLACMRTAILKRHGRANEADGCTACVQACCCTPCLAAQMMRWTDGRFDAKYAPIDDNDNNATELSPHEKALGYLKAAQAESIKGRNNEVV